MWSTQWLCCIGCGLILLDGCVSGGTTRKKASAKIAKNVTSSMPELSSRNQSLLALYSAEVETAADKIISESPSPATRRQALEWKAEAIPVMQTSLLNTDPIAAVLDTWAFLFQMNSYMERPASKKVLGEFHPFVGQTVSNMEAEMERIVRLGAPTADVADLRQRISVWAHAHPIQASLDGRQSLDPDLIKKAEQSDLGTMASIKALGESLGDLTARLNSYNLYVPKQARWQAELMLSDVTRDPQVSAALSNLGVLSQNAAKASSSMDRVPQLMGQTREAIRADVESQRLATQAFLNEQRLSTQTFLNGQRLQTLDALQHERIATIAAMRGERLAATADLRGERQVVLDTLHSQEVEALTDVKAMSDKAIQDLDTRGRRLIDHFFMRALELMLFMLGLCSLVAWLLLRRFTAKTPVRFEKSWDRAA
jgi:hypothetical protein